MRRFALCLALILACLAVSPARASTPPSLHVFTVNDRGAADLLPGSRVLMVAELRSEDLRTATLNAPTPAGLVLESYSASAGSLAVPDMFPRTAPPPFVAWTGEVSATQPINVRLLYYVPLNTAAGDLTIRVSGQAGDTPLAASTLIRVCCIAAPPATFHGYRVYLPAFR